MERIYFKNNCSFPNVPEEFRFQYKFRFQIPINFQISSFWREGGVVLINLLPELDAETWLLDERTLSPKVHLSTLLKKHLPNRLVDYLAKHWFADQKIGSFTNAELSDIAKRLNAWSFKPGGTEGYRTAEVTLGGVDTDELSSKTMAVKSLSSLYFIGEAVSER